MRTFSEKINRSRKKKVLVDPALSQNFLKVGAIFLFHFTIGQPSGFARKGVIFGLFGGWAKNELLRYLSAEDAVFCAGFLVFRSGV